VTTTSYNEASLRSQQLNVAVVGCGRWGMNYVRVLGELPQVARVFACDNRLHRLEHVHARFPSVETAVDLEAVLDAEDVDAVIVATPASTHYTLALPLLDRGLSVLLEKPMTTEVGEARKLIEAANQTGVTLAVGHTFLHNSAVQKVKEIISAGDIGRMYYLYSRRTNLGPIRGDVNALWDLAPHDISIFNYLLEDKPVWVSAVGVNALGARQTDVGFVALGYQGGVVAHVHVSWLDPFKVRELVLVGSERRVVFDDLDPAEPVRIYEKGVTPLEDPDDDVGVPAHLIRDGDIISPAIDASEPLKNQVAEFLECVVSGARPRTNAEIGLQVVAAMDAIDRSLESGGLRIEVDYGDTDHFHVASTQVAQAGGPPTSADGL